MLAKIIIYDPPPVSKNALTANYIIISTFASNGAFQHLKITKLKTISLFTQKCLHTVY